jgi:hypothetical protein
MKKVCVIYFSICSLLKKFQKVINIAEEKCFMIQFFTIKIIVDINFNPTNMIKSQRKIC